MRPAGAHHSRPLRRPRPPRYSPLSRRRPSSLGTRYHYDPYGLRAFHLPDPPPPAFLPFPAGSQGSLHDDAPPEYFVPATAALVAAAEGVRRAVVQEWKNR